MQYIIDTLSAILMFFQNIWAYIQNIFNGFSYVITYLTKTIQVEWQIIGTFPAWLSGFAIIALFMTITLVIVGRYHGK